MGTMYIKMQNWLKFTERIFGVDYLIGLSSVECIFATEG